MEKRESQAKEKEGILEDFVRDVRLKTGLASQFLAYMYIEASENNLNECYILNDNVAALEEMLLDIHEQAKKL